MVYDIQDAQAAVDAAVAVRAKALKELRHCVPTASDAPYVRAAYDAASDDLRAARAALLVCQFGFALHETLTSVRRHL